MDRIMKKDALARELAARTGFYIKNMVEVVNALNDIVIEHFDTATFDECSELHIATGVIIGGKRTPERESINPQDRSPIVTPEKVVPYAEFKPSVRLKLYKQPKGYKKKTKKV